MEEYLESLRKEWEDRMMYWCKEAETSSRAAEIESQEAEVGFMGERLRFRESILNYIHLK